MTVAEEWFVDTNVLVYATNIDSPWHQSAMEALSRARQAGIGLVVSPQILREYLVASTRTSSAPMPRIEILQNLAILQREFRILNEDRTVAAKLLELVARYEVSGKKIHDANIVATMLVYGLTHLLTYNVDDFVRFEGEIALVPSTKPSSEDLDLPRPAP